MSVGWDVTELNLGLKRPNQVAKTTVNTVDMQFIVSCEKRFPRDFCGSILYYRSSGLLKASESTGSSMWFCKTGQVGGVEVGYENPTQTMVLDLRNPQDIQCQFYLLRP